MKRYIITILGALLLVSTGYVLQVGEREATIMETLAAEEQLFAHVNPVTKVVDNVIVITQATLDERGGWEINGVFAPRNEWEQTSNKGTVKKNYAGKGYVYDQGREAFIAPKPTSTAILDEATATWKLGTLCINGATTTCP